MKALVFGQTGQVARELARRLPDGMSAEFLGRAQADLTDPDACAAAVLSTDADVVINAAAWTAVDRAETEEAVARLVNGDAPGAMARAAAVRGMPFLHLSTDYVFDGAGNQPFGLNSPVGPLSAYGRSKLAGEQAVQAAGGRFVILRTSWVVSAHGANFVKTMLRLGAERDSLNVVADQIGGPTTAADIADAVYAIVTRLLAGVPGGVQHFAGAPDVSWAEFARAIMARAGLDCAINDIPTESYPMPARRPLNSRLDCTGLTAFGLSRPDWHTGLENILQELRT